MSFQKELHFFFSITFSLFRILCHATKRRQFEEAIFTNFALLTFARSLALSYLTLDPTFPCPFFLANLLILIR
jgi:hypothetical protein